MNKLKSLVRRIAPTLATVLATLLRTEPVRVRAALTSLVVALGVVIPSLAQGHTADTIAGIGITALTILVGESARAKVTPAGK